jgi:hypothetical protein
MEKCENENNQVKSTKFMARSSNVQWLTENPNKTRLI